MHYIIFVVIGLAISGVSGQNLTDAPTGSPSSNTSAPSTSGTVSSNSSATSSNKTCFDELYNYGWCVRNATDQVFRETLPISSQVEKCFTIAKCTGDLGNITLGSNETFTPPPPAGEFTRVPFKQFQVCVDNSTEYYRNQVESCVISRVPEWKDNTKLQEQAANLFTQAANYVNDAKIRAAKICPSKSAEASAKACIDMALKKFKMPTQQEAQAGLAKLCKANTDCRNQLSSTCQRRLDEVRTAACGCLQDFWNPANDVFYKCLNNPFLNLLRKLLNGGQYFIGKAVNNFCNTFDPCPKVTASAAKTANDNAGGSGNNGGNNILAKLADAVKNAISSLTAKPKSK